MNRHPLSTHQIGVALAFGCTAAAISLLNIAFPVGLGDIQMDPGEIFVSLGAAFGGPIAGMIVGFLNGIVYAPDRNVPSHMLAGFVWGIWYAYLWRFTVSCKNRKWIRIALWTITMPVYYFVLLVPFFTWIYATFTLHVPFVPLFMTVAPAAALEMIGTIIVTDIVWTILPERFAAPVK